MNRKTIKIFLIAVGLLIIIITSVNSLIEAMGYSDSLIDSISSFPMQKILDFGVFDIIAFALLIAGITIKDKKSEIESGIKSKVQSKLKWKIVLVLGMLPFAVALIIGVVSMITGYSFFFSEYFGFDALFSSILMYSYVFWPLYIIGLALIVISIVKLKR